MCIGVPAKIVSLSDGKATVEIRGKKKEANISLLGNLSRGDYVYIQNGFAVKKLGKKEALEALSLLKS